MISNERSKFNEKKLMPFLSAGVGLSVAAGALALGSMATPLYASACNASTCQLYNDGVAYPGTCSGPTQGDAACTCAYGSFPNQTQSSCNS
jgi:hypothetical protein